MFHDSFVSMRSGGMDDYYEKTFENLCVLFPAELRFGIGVPGELLQSGVRHGAEQQLLHILLVDRL